MSKWKLRGCPRCAGDVYVEKDNDECHERCLQCGYVKQISSRFDTKSRIPAAPKQGKENIPVAGGVY